MTSGPGPISVVLPPSVPGVLRSHRRRIGSNEAPSPGQWVYVLPISPATPPIDLVPSDHLAPTFKNSWTNVAGQQAVSFRIHPATRVVIRGTIDGGSIPSIVFTLPTGFRPGLTVPLLFPSSNGGNLYSGRVDPNGDVWILATLV